MGQTVGPRTLHLFPKPGDYFSSLLDFCTSRVDDFFFSCAISYLLYKGNRGRSPVPYDRSSTGARSTLFLRALRVSETKFLFSNFPVLLCCIDTLGVWRCDARLESFSDETHGLCMPMLMSVVKKKKAGGKDVFLGIMLWPNKRWRNGRYV